MPKLHQSSDPSALYNELALRVMGVAERAQQLIDQSASDPSGGVVIGFVDYGFDLLHPCLLDASGTKSRFKFLWDQNRIPELVRQPRLTLVGICDYTAADLNQLITSAQQTGDRSQLDAVYDPHSNYYGRLGVLQGAHGTQMASIAAGTAFDGFRSPAPFADLIGVQLAVADTDWREETATGEPTWRDLETGAVGLDQDLVEDGARGWRGWRTYDACPQIVHAIHYIYDRASQLGADLVVINLSIGTWAGAHDGQSPVEQAIARVIGYGQRPGATACKVVVGAGNAGADQGHFAATLSPGETTAFHWHMNRHDRTQNKLEIWYDNGRVVESQHIEPVHIEPLQIALTGPGADPLVVTVGGTHDIVLGATRVGIADHVIGARGGLSRVRILLHPPFMADVDGAEHDPLSWLLTATRSGVTKSETAKSEFAQSHSTQLHAWVERDDGVSERSWLAPHERDHTLCCLATAPGAIVVGGASHHTSDGRLRVVPFSGRGPGPWASHWASHTSSPAMAPGAAIPGTFAPAHDIWGARSKTSGFVQTSGTSAAAALMSGTLAARYCNTRKFNASCDARTGSRNRVASSQPLNSLSSFRPTEQPSGGHRE